MATVNEIWTAPASPPRTFPPIKVLTSWATAPRIPHSKAKKLPPMKNLLTKSALQQHVPQLGLYSPAPSKDIAKSTYEEEAYRQTERVRQGDPRYVR